MSFSAHVHTTTCSLLAQLCARLHAKALFLLQASAGSGRLVSSRIATVFKCRACETTFHRTRSGRVRIVECSRNTGYTRRSMLAICHSVHKHTPRQRQRLVMCCKFTERCLYTPTDLFNMGAPNFCSNVGQHTLAHTSLFTQLRHTPFGPNTQRCEKDPGRVPSHTTLPTQLCP